MDYRTTQYINNQAAWTRQSKNAAAWRELRLSGLNERHEYRLRELVRARLTDWACVDGNPFDGNGAWLRRKGEIAQIQTPSGEVSTAWDYPSIAEALESLIA